MPSAPTTVFSLLLAGGTAAALLISFLLQAQWPDWRWYQAPLHSTMEAIGGLASIAMAVVLLQRRDDLDGNKFQPVAAGFLAMGILEVFHAVVHPGNGFVLLRNVASLAGGAGFGLVWWSRGWQRSRLPWGISMGALLFGIWTLMFPEQIPEMIQNGRFSVAAVAPQSLACLFFFAATLRLFLDYRRSCRPEDYVFASLALMFGVAELVFMSSVPWDARWWFWHVLRLAAYLLVLWEVGRDYLQTIVDLRASLEQTTLAEEALRRSLEERERIAQDLHDGVIQSIFTVTLSLERCRRLLSDRAKDAMAPLGIAIADLKLVIRDLRGYLVGLEPPISNGRELKAALASLVRSMAGTAQLQYELEVDPLAAEDLTAEQASHLLSVAREAMSNSLRHSSAKRGRLALHREEGRVRLIVEDDGIGFQVSVAEDQGHGLRNMAARARKLKGRLEVASQPGQGTCIVFDLPRETSHAPI